MEADKSVIQRPHRKDSSPDYQFEGVHGAAPQASCLSQSSFVSCGDAILGPGCSSTDLNYFMGAAQSALTLRMFFPTSSLHRNPQTGGRPVPPGIACGERNNHAANWHNYVNNSQAPN